MKKIAAIHDLAGFSRTSLGVVIPVLTTFGVQVCPLPTALLSSGTNGFDNFHFTDLTAEMSGILAHWKRIGLTFDAVYSGFLGSPAQVELVADCAESCLEEGGLLIVDPVMGDDGELEPTMGADMIERMRWLCAKASCITPNLTEAAFLLGEMYPVQAIRKGMDSQMLKDWLTRLSDMGPETVVITSVPEKGGCHLTSVAAFERKQKRFWKVACEYIPAMYPGTGDTFTSVLSGSLLRGDNLPMAMERAVQFVTLGIRESFGYGSPQCEGILLEKVLPTLCLPLTHLRYTLLE